MKKRLRLTPILIAIMMLFTMMPLISAPAHADDPIVEENGIKYSLNESKKTASVVGYDSIPEGGTVTIPSQIIADGESYTVVSIGASAFYQCPSLKSMEIPSSVTIIEQEAFSHCSNLTSVTIHDGSQPLYIGTYVFDYCSNLASIYLPKRSRLSQFVFMECSSLKTIYIPCDFNKNLFKNMEGSGIIPSETDDTYTVRGTDTTGTFEYVHEYGDASYQWSDDYTSCRAARICSVCEHEDTEDATVDTYENDIADCPGSKEVIHTALFKNRVFDNQSSKELLCSTTRNEEDINCRIQDSRGAIPDGCYAKITLVEQGTARWEELNSNLDDTHRIENLAYFEIELLHEKTDDPVLMPLNGRVRVLLTIPEGWDKEDMEAVLVSAGSDMEFEESIVNVAGEDYLAFWTDHFSPYAMIDKLSDSDVEVPKAPVPKVSNTPPAKMKAGKTSITMAWNKINGADGYDIFFAPCNKNDKKNTCKNVKSISGNNTFKWTNSGLKKGTAYKSYVKAYVMRDGKKTYISTSPVMHAYTGGGNKKYTNAKSVTVKKKKISLKKGKTYKIKAKVNKLKKGKRLMPKSHAPKLRYLTSDSSVATVNSKGKITAKGSGTCTITVFAHNGVSKNVKVTVK